MIEVECWLNDVDCYVNEFLLFYNLCWNI